MSNVECQINCRKWEIESPKMFKNKDSRPYLWILRPLTRAMARIDFRHITAGETFALFLTLDCYFIPYLSFKISSAFALRRRNWPH